MAANFKASSDRRFRGEGLEFPCAIGKGGMIPQAEKTEGDGGSPLGRWKLLRVYWRADRLPRPETDLPTIPISPEDGWCDDASDPLYNRPVLLPYPASHEKMWREDHAYDIVIELSHNRNPVEPGKGSAIFMHVARENYQDTEGCIALKLEDLQQVLKRCGPGSSVEITD